MSSELTALLQTDRGARVYYEALPPAVQRHLHGAELEIRSADDLYRAAEQLLHARGVTAFFNGEI